MPGDGEIKPGNDSTWDFKSFEAGVSILQRIIDAQKDDEGMKHICEKIMAGTTKCFKEDDQGVIWFNNRIVVPKNEELRQQILDEAHLSRYSIHPGSTKMYHDLKQHY